PEHKIYVPAPKGSPSRPFTRADHVGRFKDELAKRYSSEKVERIFGLLETFADLPDVSALGAELNDQMD
ncbi:MAG: hypothetical protein RIB59_07005, partial [Rhodospirillales bacterium]